MAVYPASGSTRKGGGCFAVLLAFLRHRQTRQHSDVRRKRLMLQALATAQDPQTSAPIEPRRLAVNLMLLSLGEFTAKLLTFASFSHLAKVLGPWHYGLLEF